VSLGPEQTQVGDTVCILLSGRVPYILREVGTGEHLLLGESYLHGIMEGEAFPGVEESTYDTFVLA
jgi:hypothetical protein